MLSISAGSGEGGCSGGSGRVIQPRMPRDRDCGLRSEERRDGAKMYYLVRVSGSGSYLSAGNPNRKHCLTQLCGAGFTIPIYSKWVFRPDCESSTPGGESSTPGGYQGVSLSDIVALARP